MAAIWPTSVAIALTSPTVSVRALPRPPLTGPADLLKPGATVSRLAPVDSMLEVIELVLPVAYGQQGDDRGDADDYAKDGEP